MCLAHFAFNKIHMQNAWAQQPMHMNGKWTTIWASEADAHVKCNFKSWLSSQFVRVYIGNDVSTLH